MDLRAVIPITGLLAGCARDPVCVDLTPHDGITNHVQTFEVALDPARRLLYSTALGSSAALVYDADSLEVLQDLPLGDGPLNTPDLELDPAGNVWIVSNTDPAVVHFDVESGDRTLFWDDLLGARDLAPRAAGGVVVLGRSAGSNSSLVAYGADRELVATLDLEVSARGLVPMEGGEQVGVATDDGVLIVLDSLDLAELQRCELALERPQRGAQLDDGTVVLAGESSIGTACQGVPQGWLVGTENMEVLSLGAEALVLDRIGDEPGHDPNLGIARRIDPQQGVVDSFVTAKNTGFGVLDPATGRLWVNSEGTSELVAYDPTSGERLDAIRTGTFLDGLAVDPEDSSVLYATGRLSDTFVRIEGTEEVASTREIHWPYSPVVDLQRDLLWVMSQTECTLHAVDREDLSLQLSIDPGLGSNTLLTFGALTMHMDRGTLFFAEPQRDVLLEIHPDSGAELQRWELGGPLIDDPDEVGELALRVAPGSQAVYVIRSNDARLQRADPSTGSLETVFLPDDVVKALGEGHRTDFVRHYPEDGILFVGGKAVRMDSLERAPERDLEVTRLAGRHPRHEDQYIAVDDAKQSIIRVREDGEVLGSIGFAAHELHATVFKVSPEESAVYMTRALHGNVCSFPLRSLR
jgi:hypothetical protein